MSSNSLTGHHKKFTLTDFHQEVVFIGKDLDHILDTENHEFSNSGGCECSVVFSTLCAYFIN